MSTILIDEAIEILTKSDNYKVIKRYEKIQHYHLPNEEKKLIGIFLDVETTGSYVQKDKIIEMALAPFEYTTDGKIYRILDSYVEFQDPGVPLRQVIIDLTGITDEMIAGKSFNTDKVNELVSSASIVIAHHAAFDKRFVEKLFPIFKDKLWGCSVAHIKWRKENIASSKLEYLAYKFGVFYKAHRAEIDSLIGIHILAQNLPITNEPALKVLLENANSKYLKIWAEDAPYEMKDILKSRGYKWNDGNNYKPKAWYKIIKESLRDEEIEFLYKEIYKQEKKLKIDLIKLFEDF